MIEVAGFTLRQTLHIQSNLFSKSQQDGSWNRVTHFNKTEVSARAHQILLLQVSKSESLPECPIACYCSCTIQLGNSCSRRNTYFCMIVSYSSSQYINWCYYWCSRIHVTNLRQVRSLGVTYMTSTLVQLVWFSVYINISCWWSAMQLVFSRWQWCG